MPKIRPLFAWYDLWVGAFWDQHRHKLYILPVPTLGVVVELDQSPLVTLQTLGAQALTRAQPHVDRLLERLQGPKTTITFPARKDLTLDDATQRLLDELLTTVYRNTDGRGRFYGPLFLGSQLGWHRDTITEAQDFLGNHTDWRLWEGTRNVYTGWWLGLTTDMPTG